MFARHLMVFLKERNLIENKHEEMLLDEIIGYGLMILGLIFQLWFGFGTRLPFPLNVFLFPVSLLETILDGLISGNDGDSATK